MKTDEMKRGFCKDYYINGEPKTYEDINKEINFAIVGGVIVALGGILSLMGWAIFIL